MRHDTVGDQILRFLLANPGRSDGEINEQLFRGTKYHAHINMTCRHLQGLGLLRRDKSDVVRNTLTDAGRLAAGGGPIGARSPEPASEPSQPATDIAVRVASYLDTGADPYHRYFSWDHCYAHFADRSALRSRGPAAIDHAALHLAWFLASWGMLRGNADLLWKNHRYLEPVVASVLRPEFDPLVGFDPRQGRREDLLHGVLGPGGLRDAVIEGFVANDRSFSVSDTLVTKVVLGTVGCSMAFDRFVKAGLRACGLTSAFGRRSLGQAHDFFLQHTEQFQKAGRAAPSYPPFKLLDMYFFDLGNQAPASP